jgi:hypothetical protein
MSLSSKPKKIVPKGSVRELKLVQTVTRRGTDSLKTEEVKTPRHGSQNAPSSQVKQASSSPSKRAKMEVVDGEPIPWDLGDSDMSRKRQTLVFLFSLGTVNSLII